MSCVPYIHFITAVVHYSANHCICEVNIVFCFHLATGGDISATKQLLYKMKIRFFSDNWCCLPFVHLCATRSFALLALLIKLGSYLFLIMTKKRVRCFLHFISLRFYIDIGGKFSSHRLVVLAGGVDNVPYTT